MHNFTLHKINEGVEFLNFFNKHDVTIFELPLFSARDSLRLNLLSTILAQLLRFSVVELVHLIFS